MKISQEGKIPCKIVETIAILQSPSPLPKELVTALGYGAAPHWVSGDKLYILNCALADATIFCGHARKKEFLWGKPGAALGKYQLEQDKAGFVAFVTDEELPADYMDHALPIFHRQELMEALDENRTFLSRGNHRRAATVENS